MRVFEDFTPGLSIECGSLEVSEAEIREFASEFDPQPFHLDADAAEASLLGGLAASGWHTLALTMKLICSGFLIDSSSMGSPGVEELRWLKPVRPGDRLTLVANVQEARASRSRPDMGLVKFLYEVTNQRGERVLTLLNLVMFARRAAVEAA